MDPKELRKALPTLMYAWPFPLLGLLWLLPFGFAATAAAFGAVSLGASRLAANVNIIVFFDFVAVASALYCSPVVV